jgi:hypothetical protein
VKQKPITVYWAPYYEITNPIEDWSILYKNPYSVFSDLMKIKSSKEVDTYFSCPAVSSKFKKTFIFPSPADLHYFFDFSTENKTIDRVGNTQLPYKVRRSDSIINGPIIEFKIGHIFFADEPLDAFFTSPYFHEPKYTKYASVVPGEFNIGQWFRPYAVEVQTWKSSGDIKFEEDEPLFYVEFKTDKNINLKRFEMNDKLKSYTSSLVRGTDFFGLGQSMSQRYNRFRSIGMREKILTEINKNLIDDSL